MLINATQLRSGMIIDYRNDLAKVLSVIHVTPGNKRGLVQTKLRSLRTGIQLEHRFRSDDKIDRITLEQHQMQYLYADGDQFHFMNTESFEQIAFGNDDLGDAVKFLAPNLNVEVDFYDGRPVGLSLPKTVDLRVAETEPGMKNATATGSLKPATLETGAVVQVPGFIEPDDVVRVDTESGEYVSRAK